MKQLVYIAALALLAGTAMPAIAQQTPVGVWRLVSWAHALQNGGDVVEPWGPHPQGFISYTPGGRMSAVVTAPERKQPGATGQQAPAEDQARLYRTLFAYAGSYTVQTEGVLVHRRGGERPGVGGDESAALLPHRRQAPDHHHPAAADPRRERSADPHAGVGAGRVVAARKTVRWRFGSDSTQ